MEKLEKNEEYANQIMTSVINLFREENQIPCNIDLQELKKGDNLTEFFTGYLKAGTFIFRQLTGQEKNHLEFTHILNHLCVQNLLESKGINLSKEAEDEKE